MEYLYYLYPIRNKVSFHFISKQHIRYLKEKLPSDTKIIEGDVDYFDPTAWGLKRKLIIHPLFYPFFDGVTPTANIKLGKLNQCLSKGHKILAFDTADSDRISEKAVSLVNRVEAVIVPSKFARDVFKDSGVKIPIHIVPHGIPDEFMTEDRKITHPDILKLKELKEDKGFIYVHFNITHSGERKGADLFAKAMSIVQKENPNVIILAKRLEGIDPYLSMLRKLRCIEVSGYLDMDAYRQLYDISDIMVLASRGGGFEHCLPPDTSVFTKEGFKEIKDIQIGDEVLTHTGNFRKVTKVFVRDYEGKVVEITPYGFENVSITLTPEHPILVLRSSKYKSRKREYLRKLMPEWIQAREIKKGDCVLIPIPKLRENKITFDLANFIKEDIENESVIVTDNYIAYRKTGSPRYTEISYEDIEHLTNETKKIVCKAVKYYLSGKEPISERVKKVIEFLEAIGYEPKHVSINRFVEFDENLAKVIGYYLAEGSVNDSNWVVEFSFGDEPEIIDDCVRAIINAFGYIPMVYTYRDGRLNKVVICNKAISKFLLKICGKGAYNKIFPKEAFEVSKEILSQLVWTMILGDGCVSLKKKSTDIRYSTVNKNLAYSLAMALLCLGYKPSIIFRESQPIYEVRVTIPTTSITKNPSNNPLNPISEDYIMHSEKRHFNYDLGYLVAIVKEVKFFDYKGKVYNLEVETDNSYTANLIAVHNCGLEALSRGVPTIVPNAGCFLDYVKYAIPVKVTENKPIVLPDNPIHVGRGWEIDVDELAKTILKVADNLSKYKRKARRNMKKIWKEYSWSNIADEILKILTEHDFIKT